MNIPFPLVALIISYNLTTLPLSANDQPDTSSKTKDTTEEQSPKVMEHPSQKSETTSSKKENSELPQKFSIKDIDVHRVTDHVYMYTSWAKIPDWGRIGSNGMIIINKGEAFLVDTPTTEKQTQELVSLIQDKLGVRLTGFAPGHWHADCVGGMECLKNQGVATYANALTNSILKKLKRPTSEHEFTESKNISLNGLKIELYFPGGGHALDNIVVWVPQEKVLFGGCLVKDAQSTNLGNTSDAAPKETWAKTIAQLQKKYPTVQTIIPGHGMSGEQNLLKHTQDLLKK